MWCHLTWQIDSGIITRHANIDFYNWRTGETSFNIRLCTKRTVEEFQRYMYDTLGLVYIEIPEGNTNAIVGSGSMVVQLDTLVVVINHISESPFLYSIKGEGVLNLENPKLLVPWEAEGF